MAVPAHGGWVLSTPENGYHKEIGPGLTFVTVVTSESPPPFVDGVSDCDGGGDAYTVPMGGRYDVDAVINYSLDRAVSLPEDMTPPIFCVTRNGVPIGELACEFFIFRTNIGTIKLNVLLSVCSVVLSGTCDFVTGDVIRIAIDNPSNIEGVSITLTGGAEGACFAFARR